MDTPKGMRDFGPQEKLARDRLIGLIKEEFERFGFLPLETPILERYDVLSAKYAGGAEILKETFKLTDQGERELGLRYDLTVPLARYVAMHPDVKLPFKRYAIGTVYRDGPIKLGRYREFYQCDADIVGADSALADAQCLQLALAVFTRIGIPFTITYNSIALFKAILAKEGIAQEQLERAMLSIDKLKKVGKEGVEKELSEHGIDASAVSALLDLAGEDGTQARIAAIEERYGEIEGLGRIKELAGLVPQALFDPSLARGLAYYTGVVFETYLESEVTSSASAGGRYDKMIGSFIGREDEYPAVGVSFGLEPIMEAMRLAGREDAKTSTQAFVIPIKTLAQSDALVNELRAAGVNADIDLLGRGISKNLDYANALGIPFVVIVGPKELEEGKYKLKDMASGEESSLSTDELVERLRA